MNLYEKLKTYTASDAYPFHMPGHKRHMGAVSGAREIDITEIDGFDNLHHAEGILKEAQERAAKLYGSRETYYLINGSTCGILAAVAACTSQRGKLLMARNCHKAVYHAAELRELETVYLYPETKIADAREENKNSDFQKINLQINGVINPRDVQQALEQDAQIEAVLITSPTYEGVVSDVKAIAEVAHAFGKPLIVDEAHGAHFGFHSYFPESSVKLGADIVIHSLHKTLPSLTQTALLHVNGSLTDSARVRKYLGIYQTSSPSYVLMAGMEECICLLQRKGNELFEMLAGRLDRFYKEAAKLRMIKVEGTFCLSDTMCADLSDNQPDIHALQGKWHKSARDLSKIVVSVPGYSGKWLSGMLRERYHLEAEMETGGYVVLLTSIGDTQKGFDRLLNALREIDEKLVYENDAEHFLYNQNDAKRLHQKESIFKLQGVCVNKNLYNLQRMTIAQADVQKKETVLIKKAAGRISAEYLYLYPPGIPLLVPGEEIQLELIKMIEQYRDAGLALQGLKDYTCERIEVCVG